MDNLSNKRECSPTNISSFEKKLKIESNSYSSTNGLKSTQHGVIYQLKLHVLFLQRGIKNNYKFSLATEMKAAEKFDDLVFKYEKEDETKECLYRVLQAKHKQDENLKISYKDLATTNEKNEFSLLKYFTSYQNIERKVKTGTKEFNKGKVEDYILCTNINFDIDELKKNNIELIDITNLNDKFFRFKNTSKMNLSKNPKRYKLKLNESHELYEILKQASNINNSEIKKFFEKLVFAVNQPNEEELSIIIKEEIGDLEDFNLIDSDFIANRIQVKMLDWFKAKEGTFFTNLDGRSLFAESKNMISKTMLISSKIEYDYKIKEFELEYNHDDDVFSSLKEFLISQNKKQILNLVTQQTTLSGIKINQVLRNMQEYQKNDSYIFKSLSSSLSMKEHLKNAFESEKSKLMIIECNNHISKEITNELFDHFSKTIINWQYKKIIFITNEQDFQRTKDEFLCNLFRNDSKLNDKYLEIKDEKIDFINLTIESKKKFLEKKTCILQGEGVKLNELIKNDNEKFIDSEMLVRFLNNEEIILGNNLPICCNYYLRREFQLINQESTETYLTEEDLIANQSKIVIVYGEAGTGKSTFLEHLLQEIKKKDKHLWLFKIDLIKYIDQLNKYQGSNFDDNHAVEFLNEVLESDEKLKFKTSLEKKLFEYSFKNKNKIVLMFDGIDEISPKYETVVISLIEALKKTFVKTIWIGSRPHIEFKEELKESLFKIKLFDKNQQIKFLKNYWQVNLCIFEDEKKLETYAKNLIEMSSESINKKEDFTGIPLHTRMLAEVFTKNENAKNYIFDGIEQVHLENINLFVLYSKFIEKKYIIYLNEKIKLDLEKIKSKENLEIQYPKFIDRHQNLALYIFFDNDKMLLEEKFFQEFDNSYSLIVSEFQDKTRLKELLFDKGKKEIDFFINKIKAGEEKTGIIDGIVNKRPRFIHETYKEYLVARFFIEQIVNCGKEKKIQRFLLTNILTKQGYKMIRKFINDALKNVSEEKILDSFGNIFDELWNENELRNDLISIIPIQINERNSETNDFVLKSLTNYKNTKFILIKEVLDVYFEFKVDDYLEIIRLKEEIFKLLSEIENTFDLEFFVLLLQIKNILKTFNII